MKNLKEQFKPTPERFSYSVDQSIKEAQLKTRKRKLSRTSKILAVSLAAVIAVPSGAFAATQLYSIVTKKVGQYAVDISPETVSAKSSPKYVKLKVNLPKNFKSEFEDIKFHKIPETANGYISFQLIRPKNSKDVHRLTDVKSAKQTEINGRSAVIVLDNENPVQNGSRRVNIYFEEVNIILESYVGSDITEKEMLDFLSGVEIVKGTKKNHTDYSAPENNDINRAEVYTLTSSYQKIKTGEKINLGNDYCTVSLNNIKILNNAKGFDRRSFCFAGDDDDGYINADGSLKPRVRETWQWGDGINTRDKKLKSESVKQKFVVVDVTYTNNTGKTFKDVGINVTQSYLKYKNGKFIGHPVLATDPNLFDGDFQYRKGYINKHEKDDLYFIPELKPYESKTFTVGFFCDEDLIDYAYLNIDNDSSNDIMSEGADFEYYIVKVKDNE